MRLCDGRRGRRRWTRNLGPAAKEDRGRRRGRLGLMVVTAPAEGDSQGEDLRVIGARCRSSRGSRKRGCGSRGA